MLKEKKTSSSKQGIQLVIVLALFGVIGYLVYANFIADEPNKVASAPTGVDIAIELEPVDVMLDSGFVDATQFSTLQKQGRYPVEPIDAGRSNPFQPFAGYSIEE